MASPNAHPLADDESESLVRETLTWAQRARRKAQRAAEFFPETLLRNAAPTAPANAQRQRLLSFGTAAAHSRSRFPSTGGASAISQPDRGTRIVDAAPWLFVVEPRGVVHTPTSAAERAAHDAARARLIALLGPALGATPLTPPAHEQSTARALMQIFFDAASLLIV
jgi:hypothetical protein